MRLCGPFRSRRAGSRLAPSHSRRRIAVVDDPFRPILCSSLPLVTPPNARSTMKAVNASPAGSTTFAKTMKTSAKPPLVIHIFSPLRTKLPSGCRAARVLAPSASDPEPDSLRQYAPTVSPDISLGRYLAFWASVPKSDSGRIVRLAWAPKVVANEADRAMRSLMIIEVALSSAMPPSDSATSTASRPSSPHRVSSRRAVVQSFCSMRSSCESTSFSTNCSAVRPTRRCSSVTRSGVQTASGWAAVNSHSPPRRHGNRRVGGERGSHTHILSKMPAAPIPPPTHMVTMP